MSQFIASGQVLVLVLGVIGLELLVLLSWRAGRERRVKAQLLAHLCAAAALIAAAELLLQRSWWGYPGLCLTAALMAHVLALRWSWRDARASGRLQFTVGESP
jgi:hypothetical protein